VAHCLLGHRHTLSHFCCRLPPVGRRTMPQWRWCQSGRGGGSRLSPDRWTSRRDLISLVSLDLGSLTFLSRDLVGCCFVRWRPIRESVSQSVLVVDVGVSGSRASERVDDLILDIRTSCRRADQRIWSKHSRVDGSEG